jgi:RES domain-containing protein
MPASLPNPRMLHEPVTAFRIGDPKGRFPIYSGEGAARVEGRWHERGQEVIYASRHYSTAMLEKLCHFNSVLPENQHYIEITIPIGTSYETITKDSLPDWIHESKARAAGSAWFRQQRSAILIVPSFVARMEENILINNTHPDAKAIRHGIEYPVWWDKRLYG